MEGEGTRVTLVGQKGGKCWEKRRFCPRLPEASPRRAGENLKEFERRPRSSRARARARTCFHSFDLLSILRVDLEDRRTRSLGSCHRSALAPRVIECAEGSRVVPQHVRRAEGLGGSAAGSAGISQEPVVRAVKLHHRLRVTDGYYPRVMESCARSGQGAREEASHFITAEKTTRGVERGEIFARAFQTRRSRAKAISAHPGPGGVAGIKGDVRRLDEYAPGMLSAHRGRIPRANSGQSEHWLEARVEQYVEQCGAVSRSVDVSFLVFSSCHGSNISWPAHPTDTLQPIFAVNLSQQFFAYPPA